MAHRASLAGYTSSQSHSLYLGTRLLGTGTVISVVVDGGTPLSVNLNVGGEDVLIRTLLGEFGAGTHTVSATHDGTAGTYFYFDFLEIAIPATTLPTETGELKLAAATDWDTLHLTGVGAGAHGLDDLVAWFSGARQSLRGCAVVL